MGRRKRKSEQVIKELWQAKGPSVEPSCLYQLIVPGWYAAGAMESNVFPS